MSHHRPARIAVLASGGGSNLQALLAHLAGPARDVAQVVWVGSNVADAGALAKAAAAGIVTAVVRNPADGVALRGMLDAAQADLLVLAGYLKLVPADVVRAFHGRVINVHPALLPAFGGPGMYGSRVHRAVVAHGAKLSGATVHFVDEVYDRGPIIAQWPVRVRDADAAEDVAARVLRVEHQLLPLVVEALARGMVFLGADGRVHGEVPLPTVPDPTG